MFYHHMFSVRKVHFKLEQSTIPRNSGCRDLRDQQACQYWRMQGECERIETQMRRYCAATCQFCRSRKERKFAELRDGTQQDQMGN